MTRKHFEELARTLAVLYGKLGDLVVDKEALLNLLLNDLSHFCSRQNYRFDHSRFKSRVLELVDED